VTPSAVEVRESARLAPARDNRLLPYSLLGVGALALALIAGQPALAALSVPFALALAFGLRRMGTVEVKTRVTLDAGQVLEGDVVVGRIELEWAGQFEAQVMLNRLNGVRPVAGSTTSWSLEPGPQRVELPIRLVAEQWGRHTVAEVWVRLEAPFGLLSWTGQVAAGPTLRVLPATEQLTRLLDPAESRAVLGAHRSSRLGAGDEFAELRPYAPGDRLRDLNWSASARHRRPFVNRRHPELSGDVVIVIDAFADGSTGSARALARAARAAWALASIHLRANDRVGLAGLGQSTRWLAPAGGRLARYQLLETLLNIGGEAASQARGRSAHRPAVPASALVIVLTPLHDLLTVRTLHDWRARGRSVAAVVIDMTDLLGEPARAAETLARRIWRIELDQRRRALAELGIPVVTAAGDGAMTPVVSALRRARRAPSLRRTR
jgi:uncharacterized protein (DUF58 family)